MDRVEFLNRMLTKGKITQKQLDKLTSKDATKEKYKKDKEKLNKAELVEILDTLTG